MLDLTKPLQRRDGVITYMAEGVRRTVFSGGRADRIMLSNYDLINVPEPLFVWVAVKDGKPAISWITNDRAYVEKWEHSGYRIVKVEVPNE